MDNSPDFLTRLVTQWNDLSAGTKDGIISGLAVAAFGGLLAFFRKGIAAAFRRLRGQAPAATQHEVLIKVETQPAAAAPSVPRPAPQPQADRQVHTTPSEVLRPHAVSFVPRRDKEGRDILEQLREKLAPGTSNLVALWGPGGVGKTRLAREAARSLAGTFAHRLVWVSADGRPDFTLSTLLDAVATHLGRKELRQLAPEPKKEQVRAIIAEAPTLVTLDNFETVAPDEQARCRDFLASDTACPALITTRDRIPSNLVDNVAIDAMSPDEARQFLAELIGQSPTPDIFDERTRAGILHTAAHIPLVIEWVVEQVNLLQEPHDVLRRLSTGDSDAARRVFDSSFNLPQVTDDGRAVLLALSLFTPDASRPALAETAGFGPDLERLSRALAPLASLRLLRAAPGGKRLLLEGLTRNLAAAHLSKSDHAADFRSRFVAFFLRYAEEHEEPTPENHDTLEAEKDNLLKAAEVAFASEVLQIVMFIAGALASPAGGMLSVRGYWDETIGLSEQALQAARFSQDEGAVARFSHNLAVMYGYRGELTKARQLYDESLEITKKLGNQYGVASTLHQLAILAQDQGRLGEARHLYDESLEIAKMLGDQQGVAITLHQLGGLVKDQGQLGEARRLYDESLEIAKMLGDQRSVAGTLHQLAVLDQDQGKLEEARRLYDESLEISKMLGNQLGVAITLHELGRLAQRLGELNEARRLYDESLEIKKRLGDQSGTAITLHQLGRLAEGAGNNIEATRRFQEALGIFERLGSPNAEIARQSLQRVKGKSVT